jgi:rhodanese-related sulfurtransferase
MKKILLIIVTLVITTIFLLGCTEEVEYIDVTASEAKDLIDTTPDLVIIDVSPYYDDGHIPSAVNYYVGDGSLDDAIPTLDKNLSYLVYCHSDSASILGATKLVKAGFDPVYRLEGNFQAWIDAGYPVEPPLEGYIDITAQGAKQMIYTNPDLIVIDVSPVYDDAHIPGAVNYYVGDGSLDDAIPTLDMNKDYLVYCHTDTASILGAEKLVDAGFDPVYRLIDNYDAWVDAGFPVTGESGYADVSAEQAKDLIDNNTETIVIDVSPYYDDGHIPGAVNYYLGDGSLDAAIPTLDKNKDYLVYCHADGPSISGSVKLVEAGFNPVYRLEGNFQAWVDAGYPVET